MPPDKDHRSREFLIQLEIERPGIDDRMLNWRYLRAMSLQRDDTVWYSPRLLAPPPYTLHVRSDYYSSLNNIKIVRAGRRPRRRSGRRRNDT